MCLLPPRDIRAIVNKLIKEGYVDYVQVPLQSASANKANATLGQGPSQLMYGVKHQKMRQILSTKIMQTILNLSMRYGELGRLTQITRDFNTLYY